MREGDVEGMDAQGRLDFEMFKIINHLRHQLQKKERRGVGVKGGITKPNTGGLFVVSPLPLSPNTDPQMGPLRCSSQMVVPPGQCDAKRH